MKIELKQAFETLGVPVSASPSDVRSAYRTLIRAHHPDHVAGDRSEANDRLAEINAAKDLIDRTPRVQPGRPRNAQANRSGETRETQRPLTPEQERLRRERDARAFRKAMEARAEAEADADRRAFEAARCQSTEQTRHAATQVADEEARRRRQAAFLAAMQAQREPSGRPSLLHRIRSLGAR